MASKDQKPKVKRRRDPDNEAMARVRNGLRERVGEIRNILPRLIGHVFIKDSQLRFVYANEIFARAHGLTPDEVVGKTDYDLFLHEDADVYRAEDRAVMEKGEVTMGSREEWPLVKVPIKDEQGKVVAVAGWSTWNDWKQELVDRLFHYASFVVSSADAFVGLSLDGHIRSWNPGAEQTYGYKRSEVLGRRVEVLCQPKERSDLLERLEEAAGGATVMRHQMVHRSKDGGRVWVSVTMSPMVGGLGAVVGVAMVVRDVTERVRMERKLKEAMAHLAGSHAEMGKVAYPAGASSSGRGAGPLQKGLERLAKQIRSHPCHQFDFREEARRLHVSFGYLRNAFRQHTGRPLHDYLLTWRMRKVAAELRQGDKPIKTIAAEAGYDDFAWFSKLFKQKIGMSPREYRHTMRHV